MTHNIYDPDVLLKLESWAVALEVTNINFLIAHFATIYENIISLHVSLTFGTVCQTVYVVDVSTINQFKARLDKFWLHQSCMMTQPT